MEHPNQHEQDRYVVIWQHTLVRCIFESMSEARECANFVHGKVYKLVEVKPVQQVCHVGNDKEDDGN